MVLTEQDVIVLLQQTGLDKVRLHENILKVLVEDGRTYVEADALLCQALLRLRPEIKVLSDFEGYFRRLVNEWVQRKANHSDQSKRIFKSKQIVITAGPWRPVAVTCTFKDGVLTIDFYSALRTGFGQLSEDDINQIIEEYL